MIAIRYEKNDNKKADFPISLERVALYLPGVAPRPPKLKGAAAGVAAGAVADGAPNENAGAAVLVAAVLAAGAPKEKPELPCVELPKENPDIFEKYSEQN